VKHLRIWLMMLLMVVLPVRGAMAAAMLCLPQNGPQKQEVMVQHLGGESSKSHDHTQHGHGHHGHAVDTQAGPDHDDASLTADDCNLCAGFCTLTLLASNAPELRHPWARAALNPASSLAAPSFVSDGEDRPPRTI
jgi:hypothetical protein